MADRSVAIDLVARVTGFVSGIKAAQTATKGFIADLEKSAAKQQSLRELGNAAGTMGLAAAAGFGLAVKSTADFDKSMSGVQAATHETSANMELLSEAALQAGADTVYSATDAAGGIEALAKAGVSTTDILNGGLNGALDLAAAGGQSVGDAAESAATAMSQFGLAGADVPHIADLLAAAAGKAQGEVSDMSMALNQTGLVANQTGLSIEETTGALAAFASKGLIGSDAGTSFKTMLQSLTPSSDAARMAVDDYNISAYDAQGNFVGLEKYAGKLAEGLGGLSDEQRNATMKTIFGSDAVRAATVLYDEGAKGIDNWTKKVNDQGFAAETAAIKLDNLSGDLEYLKGSLETALIGTGDGATGPLRDLVQWLSKLVDGYNDLSDATKSTVLKLTGFTALLGGGVWAFTRVLTGILAVKTSLAGLGVTAAGTATALSAVAKGFVIFGVAKGVAELIESLNHVDLKVEDVSDGLATLGRSGSSSGVQDMVGDWKDLGNVLSEAAWESGTIAGKFDSMGGAGSDLDERVKTLDQSFLDLAGKSLPDVQKAFAQVAKQAQAQGADYADIERMLPGFTDLMAKHGFTLETVGEGYLQLGRKTTQTKHALGATGASLGDVGHALPAVAKGFEDEAGAIDDATESLEANIAANEEAALAAITNKRGQLALITTYQEADKTVRTALRQQTTGFNENTKAGQANWDTLLGIGEQWADTTRKVRESQGAYHEARQTFLDVADALGMDSEKAKVLADRYLAMNGPMIKAKQQSHDTALGVGKDLDDTKAKAEAVGKTDPTVNVSVETGAARNDLGAFEADFNQTLSGLDDESVDITLTAQAQKVEAQLARYGGNYADGGRISGPGTGTSDSIPVWASNGEYVVKTDAVKKYGESMLHDINTMKFAAGGPVITPRVSSSGVASAVNTVGGILDSVTNDISKSLSSAANAAVKNFVAYSGRRVWPLPGAAWSTYPNHDGIDLNLPGEDYGKPFYAAASGRVSYTGWNRGYGDAIFETGPWGEVVYGHGSQVFVKGGDNVVAGQRIGLIGSTGHSTGPHLHFGFPGGTPTGALNFLQGATGRPQRYDGGGVLQSGQMAVNASGKPEAVLNPQESKAFVSLTRHVASRPSVPVSAPLRVIEGKLSIDERGQAWIRGIARDEVDAQGSFAGTIGRQR